MNQIENQYCPSNRYLSSVNESKNLATRRPV